jgi:ketosteroid isomerase-like protein
MVRWLSSWRVEPEDTHGAHLWTFREGKAIRLEVFSSRERALEAAGLRE